MKAHLLPTGILLALLSGCASSERTMNPSSGNNRTWEQGNVTQQNQTYQGLYSAPPRRTSQFGTSASGFRRTSAGLYLSPGGGHWVKSKTDDGEIVTLEDGSVWLVDVLDRIDTVLWLPISSITVVEADGGYLLINTDDGEKAHAALVSQ